MPQSKLVLVTGATGTQGGAVVEALLTRGHRVRALTRNSASSAANRLRQQGVEIAVGSFVVVSKDPNRQRICHHSSLSTNQEGYSRLDPGVCQ